MLQGLGGGNGNAEDYWKQSSFTYKFYLITSSLLFLFSILIPSIITVFIDIPAFTIWSFQIWRLFFSFYGQMPSIMSILSLIFSFLWIQQYLKDEHSTIYKIFQVIVINLEIHLVLNAISFIFTIFFDTKQALVFLGYGWFPIIIIYEFRISVTNPQAERRFCCLPFLIKNKYYPWALLAILGLLSTQFICFVACGVVGYYQETVKKQMIIKLPFAFYSKLESILPNSVKQRSDFVKISTVEANLRLKCCGSANDNNQQSRNERRPQNNSQFFSQNVRDAPENVPQTNFSAIKGQKIGGGGGQASTDFRNHWAHKDQQKNIERPEPKINPYLTGLSGQLQKNNDYFDKNQRNLQQQNDSYANFNDEQSHNKNLLNQNQKQKQYLQNKKKQQKNKNQDNQDDLI